MKLSYDKWKTTDPDAEFLGDKAQGGERRKAEMTENAMIVVLQAEIQELRELNDSLMATASRLSEACAELNDLNAELLDVCRSLANCDVEKIYAGEPLRRLIVSTQKVIALRRLIVSARQVIAKAEKLK
jgi:hypothetical protein